jgi:hypothetical protein
MNRVRRILARLNLSFPRGLNLANPWLDIDDIRMLNRQG